MRPHGKLLSLQRSALGRTDRLRTHVSSVLSSSPTNKEISVDSAVAFTIMELDNLWVVTARSFFLSVAYSGRDAHGNRVQLSKKPKANNADEALTHAIRRCRGAKYKPGSNGPWTWRDEPLWWQPNTLLNSLDEIGASNYQQVSNAMSASPRAFSHLHTFRNFYAHRSRGTRDEVVISLRRLQFPTTHTATNALTSRAFQNGRRRPQELIFDWLDDIQNTIALLV